MTRIRFAFFLALAGWAGVAALSAQTVAEDILKGAQLQGIEFRNYVGPHKVIETRAAIQGIGADLGRQMKASGTEADYAGKYHVIRVHDPASDKLSADIIVLEAGAGVDHIRNLNWIVSSYLQQAFGYSVTDGDLLADFVTRYNAFYRGKMDYVTANFIPAVAAAVTADKVGLALSYADWPGKTQMLLPLRDSLSKGLSGSVNTEEISNKDITTQMAQQPGGGLDERKKLANLKEAEIVQEQKAVTQAEAKVAAVPSTPGTTPASPTSTPAASPAAPPAAATTPAPAAATAPATTAPATTPAQATPPAATPPPAPAALPLAAAKQQLAARDQALQTERQNIVQQEAKQPAPTPAAPAAPAKPASTVAFVRMNDAKMGQLWLIDPSTNKVWKKSELNSVRQTQAPAFGAGLLVVAGDAKAANGAVRLVLVSKDDATILVTGADDVSPDTPLIIVGNQVLALTKSGANWVLASFDATLKATAKGTDALTTLTAVVPTAGGILVQSAGGTPLLLDSATLQKKSATEG
jgi:hypothetical protein